jgi:hypothetical protein
VALGVVVAVLVVLAARSDRPEAGRGPQQVLALAEPAALRPGGSVVDSQVRRRGDVRVVTWIRTDRPVGRVRVSVPDVPGLASSARASDVRVAGDRLLVDGPGDVGRRGRTYRLAAASRLVYLSYTLHDVVDRRSTVPGRALLRLTALDVTTPADVGRTRVSVHGVRVLAAACLGRGDSVARPCGAPHGGRWRVDLRGVRSDARVQAQVDLTTPAG